MRPLLMVLPLLCCGCGEKTPVGPIGNVPAETEAINATAIASPVAELTPQERSRLMGDAAFMFGASVKATPGSVHIRDGHVLPVDPSRDAHGAEWAIVGSAQVTGRDGRMPVAVYVRNGAVVRTQHLRIGTLR